MDNWIQAMLKTTFIINQRDHTQRFIRQKEKKKKKLSTKKTTQPLHRRMRNEASSQYASFMYITFFFSLSQVVVVAVTDIASSKITLHANGSISRKPRTLNAKKKKMNKCLGGASFKDSSWFGRKIWGLWRSNTARGRRGEKGTSYDTKNDACHANCYHNTAFFPPFFPSIIILFLCGAQA